MRLKVETRQVLKWYWVCSALGVGSAAGVNTIILSNVAMAEVLLATDRADKSLEHAIAATEMNLNSAQVPIIRLCRRLTRRHRRMQSKAGAY